MPTDTQWAQLVKATGREGPTVKLPPDATLVTVKDDKAYWVTAQGIDYVTNLEGGDARITPEKVKAEEKAEGPTKGKRKT